MSSRIHLFANGIANVPGKITNWNDRAVSWCIERGLLADKFEYLSGGLLFRWLTQRGHVRDLVEVLNGHAARPLTLVGHSNGCDLIVKALQTARVSNAVVHLISPACGADCRQNGLNLALRLRKVSRLYVHYGGKDAAMRWARLSQLTVGMFGLGYGTMGLDGPTNVDDCFMPRVLVHREPDFGHSTWFEPKYFETTMRLVTHP